MANLMTSPRSFYSCPTCGQSQFVVKEFLSATYLTGRDGEILDYTEDKHTYMGMCVRCGKVVPMVNGYHGFIPCTPIRKIILDNYDELVSIIPEEKPNEVYFDNPMEVE